MTALMNDARLTPGARAVNTFRATPRALGAAEPLPPGATRFLIDFSGGDLGYYLGDPTHGRNRRHDLGRARHCAPSSRPTRMCAGFAPAIDVADRSRPELRHPGVPASGVKALTETWTFPWRA